jgi:hypothetical protein
MHEHIYSMPLPYVVLRRLRGPIDDMGDYEYFLGHKARVWLAWLPPYARWEKMHMPTHEGLWRFRDRDEARAYIRKHKDMQDRRIEMVNVSKSE